MWAELSRGGAECPHQRCISCPGAACLQAASIAQPGADSHLWWRCCQQSYDFFSFLFLGSIAVLTKLCRQFWCFPYLIRERPSILNVIKNCPGAQDNSKCLWHLDSKSENQTCPSQPWGRDQCRNQAANKMDSLSIPRVGEKFLLNGWSKKKTMNKHRLLKRPADPLLGCRKPLTSIGNIDS